MIFFDKVHQKNEPKFLVDQHYKESSVSCLKMNEPLKDWIGKNSLKVVSFIWYPRSVTILSHYLRTCHDLQAGHYLSSLASVQPCNPAAVALVSALGSSVTQTDTMAALYSPRSIVLPWTWRHNEALIQTEQRDGQARCQVLFFQACLWAEPTRRVCLKLQSDTFSKIGPINHIVRRI